MLALSQIPSQPGQENSTMMTPMQSPPTSTGLCSITETAARQTLGDVYVAQTRKQPLAASNYTDGRILLRLTDRSSFFEKQPKEVRSAIFGKLTLSANDTQNITKTNTGWSAVARNTGFLSISIFNMEGFSYGLLNSIPYGD